MLIARATTRAGNDLLLIGLSKENRKRLDDGMPIDITTKSHGQAVPTTLHLLIFAGLDEASMERELQQLIGRDTVIEHREPRQEVG
jgi:hypothetical protein